MQKRSSSGPGSDNDKANTASSRGAKQKVSGVRNGELTPRMVIPMTRTKDESTTSNENCARTISSKYLKHLRTPIVLLPDLKDVLMKRTSLILPKLKESNRVPFRKVNTLPVKETPKAKLRRNAARACRKSDPSSSSLTINSTTSKPTFTTSMKLLKRSPRVNLLKLKLNTTMRVDSPTSFEDEPTRCNYCKKQFNVAEFALEHELSCVKNPCMSGPGDIRDNADEKVNFLNGLHLKPVVQNSEEPPKQKIGPTTSHMRLFRLERLRVVKLLRNNPIPLSSAFGQQIISESGAVWCERKEQANVNHDQFCNAVKSRSRLSRQAWPTSISRKMKFKDGMYVHKASFSRQQRTLRNSEIILGLNKKAWSKFNKCKEARVKLHKLSDEEIATMMNESHKRKHNSIPRKPIKCKKLIIKLENLTESPKFLKLFPKVLIWKQANFSKDILQSFYDSKRVNC